MPTTALPPTPTAADGFPVKCVDWAYPTSTSAARFKYPKGCYVMNISTRRQITRGRRAGEVVIETDAVAGFATEAEAVAAAEARPESWAGWSRHLKSPHEVV